MARKRYSKIRYKGVEESAAANSISILTADEAETSGSGGYLIETANSSSELTYQSNGSFGYANGNFFYSYNGGWYKIEEFALPDTSGEQIYRNLYTGGYKTWTFTVPDGVTSLCVVCVGPGGAGVLQRGTRLSTATTSPSEFGSPSDSFYFTAGNGGCASGDTGGTAGTPGGNYDGGGNGGVGGSSTRNTGGAGAGGYTGNGGNSGGGDDSAGQGGGVGVYGQGANGIGAPEMNAPDGQGGGGGGGAGCVGYSNVQSKAWGTAGSGGSSKDPTTTPYTTYYGGGAQSTGGGGSGGGGALAWKNDITVTPGQNITVKIGGRQYGGHTSTRGGAGAVRIVWGDNRSFPTTNVLESYSDSITRTQLNTSNVEGSW